MAERREPISGSGEWSTAYAHFLLRAAGQSARTLQLYEQVLGCVSRGQLAPTTVRDFMARFLQARGGECTSQLAKLGGRFMAQLAEGGNACVLEAANSEASGDSAANVLPEFDSADPVGWCRRLGEYAARRDARVVQSNLSHLTRVAAGEIAPGQIHHAESADDGRRLAERLRQIGRLCFDLLNALTDLRTGYAEEYLRGVLAMVRPNGLDGDVLLRLVAPVGETSSASISLANTRKNRTIIRCAVTDVRRADGVGRAFAPRISISPNGLLLESDQEADVRLSLRLDADVYEPDAAYVGALRVIRHGEPPAEVPLLITATARARAAEPAENADTKDPQ